MSPEAWAVIGALAGFAGAAGNVWATISTGHQIESLIELAKSQSTASQQQFDTMAEKFGKTQDQLDRVITTLSRRAKP